MKVVVIGGSGLVGSKIVKLLGEHGHDAVPASPQTGLDVLTGEGLDEALAGADVVVDVTNSPSFADDDVMHFFTTATTNMLEAEKRAGIKHHVALSIVGCDRAPDSGYLRAKVAQENLIAESGQPYCIVRATQFYEFGKTIADSATVRGEVHLPPVGFQPIAAEDVARAVGRMAAGEPINGHIEVAGPTRYRFDEFIADVLRHLNDPRRVVSDPQAPYFGEILAEDTIVPGDGAELASTTFEEWREAQVKR